MSAPSDGETPTSGVVAPASHQVSVPVDTQNTSPEPEISASTSVEVSAPSDAETLTGRLEVSADDYRGIMRGVCADELSGIKCRTKSYCENGSRICPEFGNNKVSIKDLVKCPTDHSKACPFTSFFHSNFVHIRKTCHAVLKNKECQYPLKHNGEPCPFGHDSASLRRLIWTRRKELAYDNQAKRGQPTHQSGARKRAKK